MPLALFDAETILTGMTGIAELLKNALPEYPLIVVESGVTLSVLALAFYLASAGFSWFGGAERALSRIAQRRGASVVLACLCALALRAALLPALPVPEPSVHDEFSYLLGADTFASGRLTNAPHPFWQHFETFHVLQQPTYASKYPPAQSLILAFGKVAGGHAWAGVWLSVGLMCAALCWMLQGWLPPRWALLGGLLAAVRLGLFTGWINGYMGGAAAATGGALVLGAWPRIIKRQRVADALLFGLGMAILANSRPFEGFVMCLPLGAGLLLWLLRRKGAQRLAALKTVVLPLSIVLVATLALMGFYFSRVTGSPLWMPYQVYQKAYDPVPLFLWQRLGEMPQYRHEVMRDFGMWEVSAFEKAVTLRALVVKALGRIVRPWQFYVGPALTLPLLMSPLLFRDRRMRLLLLTGGILLLAVLTETWFDLHYIAPATGLIYALILQCMRHLYVWTRRGRRVGRQLVRTIPLVCLLMVVVRLSAAPLNFSAGAISPAAGESFGMKRARVVKQLEAAGGRHLVVVRYGKTHEAAEEWVYNEADIERARIVWAREMDAAHNRALVEHFKERHIWLLEPDGDAPKLSPYTASAEREATTEASQQ